MPSQWYLYMLHSLHSGGMSCIDTPLQKFGRKFLEAILQSRATRFFIRHNTPALIWLQGVVTRIIGYPRHRHTWGHSQASPPPPQPLYLHTEEINYWRWWRPGDKAILLVFRRLDWRGGALIRTPTVQQNTFSSAIDCTVTYMLNALIVHHLILYQLCSCRFIFVASVRASDQLPDGSQLEHVGSSHVLIGSYLSARQSWTVQNNSKRRGEFAIPKAHLLMYSWFLGWHHKAQWSPICSNW